MDITRYELTFPASNGGHDIYACVWRDADCKDYRAVVQLVHGMAEYILRYEEFAVYLARRGYVVVGNDHAGHGRSVEGDKNRGYFGKNDNSWKYLINDMNYLEGMMRMEFPDIPYFMLGHSMGSFLAREYIAAYGNGFSGAVFMGSGYTNPMLPGGILLSKYMSKKKPGEKGIGTALHQALVGVMSDQLTEMGIEADSELVRFDEIQSIEAITPKFSGDSRLMTELRFTVKISTRNYVFRQTPSPEPSASPTPDAPDHTIAPTQAPLPTATPSFSSYKKVKDALTVTLPIFTTAEQAMGLSINVAQNELFTVSDIGSAFMIESRRFGHGVGMSQRGAEQMARQHGMTYEQILAFYYPGMGLAALNTEKAPLPTLDIELMATPAPTPSPTPRPTLMPVTTENLPDGAYLASVTNIDEDSTLNLRAQPNTSADVLRRLYKNQKLVVLSVSKDGWAHVKTDVMEGYVRNEYLQAEKDS